MHIDIIENLPSLARVEDDWIVLETKSGRNLGGRIDPRCIPDLLQQATELHRKGQSADAEIGYRRILEVEPKHADALHRLGQLLAAKGDFAAAKRMFRILTTVRPHAAKAWQCLGQVCESLGQHEEALRQHLEFMRLQPDLPDSFVAVGRCMVKLGRMAEINAALLAAIEPASARRSGSGVIGGPRRTGRPPANTRPRHKCAFAGAAVRAGPERSGTMVTMNAIDRHLSSEGAPGNDIIVDEILGGLLHAVARDGSQPGPDGRTLLLPPWLTAAMASGPRRRSSIAWCAGGFPAGHSAPNVFHRRPNR